MAAVISEYSDFWVLVRPQDVEYEPTLLVTGSEPAIALVSFESPTLLTELSSLLPLEHAFGEQTVPHQVVIDDSASIFNQLKTHRGWVLTLASNVETVIKNAPLQWSAVDLQIIAVPITIIPDQVKQAGFYSSTTYADWIVQIHRQNLSSPSKVSITSDQKIPRATSEEFLWEDSISGNSKARTLIPFNSSILKDKNIFVSRTCDGFNYSELSCAKSVWVAGQKSWQSLKAAGIVVNGSTDSLGEHQLQNPQIKKMFPGDWIKLTNDSAQSYQNTINSDYTTQWDTIIAYYHVDLGSPDSTLGKKTHFFWKSASSFFHATATHPDITSQYHASGLGQTASILAPLLSKGHFQPFLNSTDWRNSIL